MDGLITVEELFEEFDIDSGIKPERFTRALVAAGREMRAWVGDAAYDDALLLSPVDATRKVVLQHAEAYLVMHFAVLGINTALRPGGIVRTEKTGDGNVVITYQTPAEVANLRQQYIEEAQDLARVYLLPVEESAEPFGAVVGGSGSNCEAVTRCG